MSRVPWSRPQAFEWSLLAHMLNGTCWNFQILGRAPACLRCFSDLLAKALTQQIIAICDGNSHLQCHAEGGATKGGVSKCEQTQANASKRRQTRTNASKRRGANASKREQTWTNANKRLHPPLLRFFTPPFAIP